MAFASARLLLASYMQRQPIPCSSPFRLFSSLLDPPQLLIHIPRLRLPIRALEVHSKLVSFLRSLPLCRVYRFSLSRCRRISLSSDNTTQAYILRISPEVDMSASLPLVVPFPLSLTRLTRPRFIISPPRILRPVKLQLCAFSPLCFLPFPPCCSICLPLSLLN